MNRVFDHVSRGLLLITLGIIFLLHNYGYLSWRLWVHVVELWPLILVLAGVGLLFNRRIPFSTILLIFILSMVGYSLVVKDKPMPERIFNRLESSPQGSFDLYSPGEFNESTKNVKNIHNIKRALTLKLMSTGQRWYNLKIIHQDGRLRM